VSEKNKKGLPIIAWIFIGIFACALALGLASYFTVKSVMQGSPIAFKSSKGSAFFNQSAALARINILGPIFESEELEKINEGLDEIEKSKSIKGLLLRISSPGGSVAPTQEIFNRLMEIRKKMPVICSLGDIAASGGYYIAAACSEIFVNPGTLTGSIGVIMQLTNLKELYTWAKVKPVVMKAGRYKDMGSPLREMKDDEKALIDGMLEKLHTQFQADVRKGRSEAKPDIEAYADGRIFSGEQAVDYAFADKLGGAHDAILRLKELSKVDKDAEFVVWPRKENDFRSFFSSQVSSIKDSLNLRKALGLSAESQLQNGIPYFLPSFWTGGNQP